MIVFCFQSTVTKSLLLVFPIHYKTGNDVLSFIPILQKRETLEFDYPKSVLLLHQCGVYEQEMQGTRFKGARRF